MAGPTEDLDRSEPATEFKLEKARRRGAVPRSSDVIFAAVLLACVACLHGLGTQFIEGLAQLLRRGLPAAARGDLSRGAALSGAAPLALQALATVAPIVSILWLAAMMMGALQARGVFTAQPLKPDFARLNPAQALARVFSMRSLHDLWRSAIKLAAIFTAMALWGPHQLPLLLGLQALPPGLLLREAIALLGSALTLLAGLMLILALLDWSFNRWEFLRKLRMSKRETKDEHKEREGDPRIKARLRELRTAWLRRARQLSKVRRADVLLTNPTHYAVALEYQHGRMPAPMITARGAGEMARRMRAEARRRHVPVVEHPALARALFAVQESQLFVPEEHFNQVARILRWVYAARGAGCLQREGA